MKSSFIRRVYRINIHARRSVEVKAFAHHVRSLADKGFLAAAGHVRLRRPHTCQKRPTTGAKETYCMRTLERLPA